MTATKALTAVDRVTRVREQFRQLTGYEPGTVSGLARSEGGWELTVEIVEVPRVPDTASLLATYRVSTDEAGDIVGYERVRRYSRGRADD